MSNSADKIEKVIELSAPVSKVWRALTDHREFGQWFRVVLDGPFEPGAVSTGMMSYPGYENHPWLATVERMEHERLFSFRWHHEGENSGADISQEPTTLVEFRLEPRPEGTRLTITETGFSELPASRRVEIMRGNTKGWEIQSKNIADYVAL